MPIPAGPRRLSPVAVLLALVAVYQLTLLGTGTMAFPDETYYGKALSALVELRSGHLFGFFNEIAMCDGRPGEAVVKLIPAALQIVPRAFGIAPNNPVSLMVPTAANIVMMLVVICLLYRIALLVFDGDVRVAVTVAAIYSLLVNTHLYIRHLVPYDWSLAILMWSLWLALTRPRTIGHAALVGALIACALTVYPGYYHLAAAIAFALVFAPAQPASSAWWKRTAAGAAGGASVFALLEAMTRAVGRSYFLQARHVSETIEKGAQGTYSEGWIFVPEYLLTVERLAGVVLLLGLAVYLVRLATDLASPARSRLIHWLVVPAIVAWVVQAFVGAVLGDFIFYGRLVHQWMPLLALATGYAIAGFRREPIRRLVCASVIAAALISWVPSAYQYSRLAYPGDVAYRFGIDLAKLDAVAKPCELDALYWYSSPTPRDMKTGAPYDHDRRYVIVNACLGTPAVRPVETPENPVVIFERPHFQTFPAYGFEGFKPDEREGLRSGHYTVRVIARRSAGSL